MIRAALLSAAFVLAPIAVQAEEAVAEEGKAEAFAASSGEVAVPVDHAAFARFLDAYVTKDEAGLARVDYAGVTPGDHQALERYVARLAAIDPAALSRDEAFAYWANLYNALTLDVVLDAYPVASIRDIRFGFRAGPWRKKLVEVAGERLSLDDIEHAILREHWDEPRVHFAVNCASVGCPNLAAEPFRGATLDEQLEAATHAYVNSPRGFRAEEDRLIASSIFDWYADDFGGEAGVLAFARRYAEGEIAASLTADEIDGYDYDWELNAAR